MEDADKTKVSRSEVCVFAAEEDLESIKAYATVSHSHLSQCDLHWLLLV